MPSTTKHPAQQLLPVTDLACLGVPMPHQHSRYNNVHLEYDPIPKFPNPPNRLLKIGDIRWLQDTAHDSFSTGQSLWSTLQSVVHGKKEVYKSPQTPDGLPTIRVIPLSGQWFSVDTRRPLVYKIAFHPEQLIPVCEVSMTEEIQGKLKANADRGRTVCLTQRLHANVPIGTCSLDFVRNAANLEENLEGQPLKDNVSQLHKSNTARFDDEQQPGGAQKVFTLKLEEHVKPPSPKASVTQLDIPLGLSSADKLQPGFGHKIVMLRKVGELQPGDLLTVTGSRNRGLTWRCECQSGLRSRAFALSKKGQGFDWEWIREDGEVSSMDSTERTSAGVLSGPPLQENVSRLHKPAPCCYGCEGQPGVGHSISMLKSAKLWQPGDSLTVIASTKSGASWRCERPDAPGQTLSVLKASQGVHWEWLSEADGSSPNASAKGRDGGRSFVPLEKHLRSQPLKNNVSQNSAGARAQSRDEHQPDVGHKVAVTKNTKQWQQGDVFTVTGSTKKMWRCLYSGAQFELMRKACQGVHCRSALCHVHWEWVCDGDSTEELEQALQPRPLKLSCSNVSRLLQPEWLCKQDATSSSTSAGSTSDDVPSQC